MIKKNSSFLIFYFISINIILFQEPSFFLENWPKNDVGEHYTPTNTPSRPTKYFKD